MSVHIHVDQQEVTVAPTVTQDASTEQVTESKTGDSAKEEGGGSETATSAVAVTDGTVQQSPTGQLNKTVFRRLLV